MYVGVFFNILEIVFDAETVRLIKIPKHGIQGSTAIMKFHVWHRPFGQKTSQLLGECNIKFSDIFEAPDYTLIQNTPVLSKTGSIVIGSLHLEISLGCNGLHFGIDFLDAISSHKENIVDPFNEFDIYNFNNRYNDNYQIPVTNQVCCRASKFVRQIVGPTYQADDKQTNQVVSSVSVAQQTDAEQDFSVGGKHDRNHQDNNQNNDDKHFLAMKPSSDSTESNILHGLLYIGSISHTQAPSVALDNIGYFIICRSFWKDDVTATAMCENNIFNFMEV